MEQFYEPPPVNRRIQVPQIFAASPAQTLSSEFVPYSQERDKLGRLISSSSSSLAPRNSSLANKRRSSQAEIAVSERGQTSDRTVEKVFKLQTVRPMKVTSHEAVRMKLLIPSDKLTFPEHGNYASSAQLAAKIKFHSNKQMAFREEKIKTTRPPQPTQKQQSRPRVSSKMQEGESGVAGAKRRSLAVDYNLPELQKYHEMRKLKMMHYDNFEENHLRFKELVRHSLVLAQKIKKGLELD